MIASGSEDKIMHLWDVKKGKLLRTIHLQTTSNEPLKTPDDGSTAMRIVYSPDGKVIATSCADDKTIQLWNAENGELLKILHGNEDFVNVLAYSPDGKVIATGSNTIQYVYGMW